MASSINKLICTGCLKSMNAPILQCLNEHSLCRECFCNSTICKICSTTITTVPDLQLEQLINKMEIAKLKTDCPYVQRGCKYTPNINDLESHTKECRYRKYICEGKVFCDWNCSWTGDYDQILQHFETSHAVHSNWEYKQDCNIRMNLEKNVNDIRVINFGNGSQVFWYKHKTDISKKKCYWLFQCVGTQKFASQHHYEFEIYLGSIRKLKITEICTSDTEDAEELFDTEKCVCVSFQTIGNFMVKNRLNFRFRIMRTKESTDATPAHNNRRAHRSSVPDLSLPLRQLAGATYTSSPNHSNRNRRARRVSER